MNRGPERNILWATAKQRMENHNIHASETAWVGTGFDAVIDNNGTMDQLFQQITDLLRDLRVAKANPLS
jgi:dephospho-CoA kinase